jgi:hypothetical protein
MAQQGSLELLDDPVAKALLESVNPARLAYTWMDGSPRVVPIWFHWTGEHVVLGSPPKAPKLKALAADPRVALTIDDNQAPWKVLLVRGRASVEMLDDLGPEYELSATRYFGPEQGPAWASALRGLPDPVPQCPDALGPGEAGLPPERFVGTLRPGMAELPARGVHVAGIDNGAPNSRSTRLSGPVA